MHNSEVHHWERIDGLIRKFPIVISRASSTYREEEVKMRMICVLGFALLFLNGPAFAQQGPCTEARVKTGAAQPNPPMSSDFYFFSGALEKPVVGKQALDQAAAPISAARKNEKDVPNRPDRVVAAPSADMAYEYGTGQVSFDDAQSGKHYDFTAAYLRVWKAEGGSCKVAAVMYEPEGPK